MGSLWSGYNIGSAIPYQTKVAISMKIGFVLLSSSKDPQPSTRISVLNMLPYLRKAGIQTELVFEPPSSSETPDLTGLAKRLIREKFTTVYFQKVHGESVEKCVQTLNAAGVGTIYGVCDLVEARMAKLVDMTLVVTDFLKDIFPVDLQKKIHVVHDGIERPNLQKSEIRLHVATRNKPIRAVLISSSRLQSLPILRSIPDWLDVTIVGRYPPTNAMLQRVRESRWALSKMATWRDRLNYIRFLADRRIRTVMWQAGGVYDAMQDADIGIIPIERSGDTLQSNTVPSWKMKSENRLTMKMAFRLPVVATPIPSYESVVNTGKNAFFADSRADWIQCLEALRDPAIRSEMADQARASVIERYSKEKQATLLIAAFQTVDASRQSGIVDKTSSTTNL